MIFKVQWKFKITCALVSSLLLCSNGATGTLWSSNSLLSWYRSWYMFGPSGCTGVLGTESSNCPLILMSKSPGKIDGWCVNWVFNSIKESWIVTILRNTGSYNSEISDFRSWNVCICSLGSLDSSTRSCTCSSKWSAVDISVKKNLTKYQFRRKQKIIIFNSIYNY